MDERRQHPRIGLVWPGKVVVGEGENALRLNCLVHDLSKGGARLTALDTPYLPNEFSLGFFAGSDMYPCRVMWRSKRAAGVAFAELLPEEVISALTAALRRKVA
jgi:hypothetical protein